MAEKFANQFDEAYAFLLDLPRYDKRAASALKPGFERIIGLLERMGNPQETYPSVLVAGTNGKGSTASMMSAICSEHGLRTGLHTSPHIRDVTERMRVDGVQADRSWLVEAIRRHDEDIRDVAPSFFEATLALSLLYFAERNVDIAVVEVGLGGRLDATNILKPLACAITRIGFDHTDILGDTLPQIAGEKAGILKPDTPAWTSNDDPAVLATLRERATAVGTQLSAIGEVFSWYGVVPGISGTTVDTRSDSHEYRGVEVSLRGRHQAENALLAIAVCEHLLSKSSLAGEAARTQPDEKQSDEKQSGTLWDPARAGAALANVGRLAGLSGRLQVLQRQPLIVADAAHNPSGIQSALAWLGDVAPDAATVSVALGMMRDKAVDEVVALLAPRCGRLYPIPIDSERALPVTEISDLFGYVAEICAVDGVRAAITDFTTRAHARDVLLITGSQYMLEQLES